MTTYAVKSGFTSGGHTALLKDHVSERYFIQPGRAYHEHIQLVLVRYSMILRGQ